jgi:hypothetical protein
MKHDHCGLINLFLAALLVGIPMRSRADDERMRFELTPFGGYRFSGSVPLDDPHFSKVDLADSGVFGLAAGVEVPEGLLEFMWTHQDSSARVLPVSGGPAEESFDLSADQFHLNGLYFPPEFEHYRPYVLAGLGMTRYAPSGDIESMNRFSWALGGGVKVPFSQRLALRLEAKWDPALTSSSTSVFCNSSTGTCLVGTSGKLIDQFDLTAGLSLRI